jgi:quercetin dioxygenase-like cupin family protein
MGDLSKVIPFTRFRWQGIEVREYKAEDTATFKDVTRQTLLGEAPDELALSFLTRYFEIQPGGHSTLERHQHPHCVIVIRGSGEVELEGVAHPIAPFDCIYVAPGAAHQFRCTGERPLGFICVVDRERDRPVVVSRNT